VRLAELRRSTRYAEDDPVMSTQPPVERAARPARRWPSLELLAAGLVAVLLLRGRLADALDAPAVQTWTTVLVAVVLQALPFLVLGVLVGGAVAAFVPAGGLARAVPTRPAVAVPAAGLAGVVLPGCECSAVPIAGRLIGRGAPAPAALAFLLAAPAINPVVLVATAVAFPGQPRMVAARFAASLATSVVVGLLWSRIGSDELLERARCRVVARGTPLATFLATAQHDLVHAGGYLVLGAMAAATLHTALPTGWLDAVAGTGALAVAVLAALAVLLALCSEADAFVAASLSQFSLTARLVFLVVGPAVDVKLVALQAGTFGRPFAARFAPLTLAVAVACALLAGWALL
jgi:uncharacterized membrane protein YraQ (UPF0718 family)